MAPRIAAQEGMESVIALRGLSPPTRMKVLNEEGEAVVGASLLGTLPIPSSGEVTFRVPADKRLQVDQQKAGQAMNAPEVRAAAQNR